MRTFIAIMIVLLPCAAFAATDCRIIEFPDHTEAICVGDPAESPASPQTSGQNRAPAAGISPEALAADREPDASASLETERPEVVPENIERNGLARAYGKYILNNSHGRW
jgi:hypothetical protein